ncbi:MAG: serine/threonine-protein kinase [Myxococcota bacterium]
MPAPLVAGRYHVGDLVGRGGGGQVHRGVDTFTGDDVALKFVRRDSQGASAQLRRELTALRLVDLPGVVRLRDDGLHDGFIFLVMNWLDGGLFDSLGATGWEKWKTQAFALLEAVGRLHFLGLVHGDLKPSNVLLDAAQRPVITDFGLASGAAVTDTEGWIAGTARYMAPEQRRGEPLDGRADLYALGVMFESMGAPPDACSVFRWMQAAKREDRPDSVEAVLEALGAGGSLVGVFPELSDRVTVRELRRLFLGRPSFLHVAEDAAAVLLQRTTGRREAVCNELERWIRAGLCYRDGPGVVIRRDAVERIIGERRAVSPSLDAALRAHRRGETRQGLAILAALDDRSPDAADATVDLALSLWSPPVVRAAAYQAERRGWTLAGQVLGAAQAVLSGNAEKALAALGPPSKTFDRLQGWRLGVGISAALRTGQVDGWLDAADRWASDDAFRRARLAAWRGRIAYVRGDFEAALTHERQALSGATVPVVRLSRLTTAAAAALETSAMAEARAWATQARRMARRLRHGVAEARAWWLVRTIALRSGAVPPPQPQWVPAAQEVHGFIGAQLALTECALAWHHEQIPLAAELSIQALDGFGSRAAIADLARALAWRCGVSEPPTQLSGGSAELDLQTWTLCAEGGLVLGTPPTVPEPRLVDRWLDVLPGDRCREAVSRWGWGSWPG